MYQQNLAPLGNQADKVGQMGYSAVKNTAKLGYYSVKNTAKLTYKAAGFAYRNIANPLMEGAADYLADPSNYVPFEMGELEDL